MTVCVSTVVTGCVTVFVLLTTTVLWFVTVCWFVTTLVSVFTVGTSRVSVTVFVFPLTTTVRLWTTGT